MMRVYVASSWRNEKQQNVVAQLRIAGHEVYDERISKVALVPGDLLPAEPAVAWNRLPEVFRDQVLRHPTAVSGFAFDMNALNAAEATVLVLPCGRSAHLELGYATGAGQKTVVLLDDPMSEPELMYLMNTYICVDIYEVIDALRGIAP
jgi:hypothetical protein